MKKVFIAMMMCAALASCGNKQDKAAEDNDNTAAEEATAEVVTTAAVQEAEDDDPLTPDMTVEQPLIIDFNATWCGPCQKFKPVFHAAAEKYGDRADFVSVDADACPTIMSAFGVNSLPTLIVILPDGTSNSYVGLNDFMSSEESFDEYIESLL